MPASIAPEGASAEGLRERKRRETRRRIAEAGQRLFLANGYDRTTLDAIAVEAGISRRTFFSYFKSKDEILLFWQEQRSAGVFAELLETSPDVAPLDAVRDVMVKHVSRYSVEEMTAIDNLMRSSPAVMAGKQAKYLEQEQALFSILCQVWRQPERRLALRMVSVMAIGALRLSIQAWYEQPGRKKPPAKFLRDAFDCLKVEA
jgi:AcrR family transcriptional regulator